MNDKQNNLEKVIKELEPWLLEELREDYCYLGFIRYFVNKALENQRLHHEQVVEQEIKSAITLELIIHLIKNRGCKVFDLESTEYESYATLGNFIEWHLSHKEMIEKIKIMWPKLKNVSDPIKQPWFTIDEDKSAAQDSED